MHPKNRKDRIRLKTKKGKRFLTEKAEAKRIFKKKKRQLIEDI